MLTILCLVLSGCDSKGSSMDEVQEKIDIFQNQYNNHDFKEMYNQTSDGFKKAMSEDKFNLIMQDKIESLGLYKKSKVLYSLSNDDAYVKITYISEYEKYTLAEEFGYQNKGDGNGFKMLSFLVDMGGYISPVTKTKDSLRLDVGVNSN
jgi:hypothetical protein